MTPNQAPTSSASNHVSGFSGLLAALQKDYQTKGASVCDLLDRLIAQENSLSAIEQWKNLLEENISSFSSCLDSCLEPGRAEEYEIDGEAIRAARAEGGGKP